MAGKIKGNRAITFPSSWSLPGTIRTARCSDCCPGPLEPATRPRWRANPDPGIDEDISGVIDTQGQQAERPAGVSASDAVTGARNFRWKTPATRGRGGGNAEVALPFGSWAARLAAVSMLATGLMNGPVCILRNYSPMTRWYMKRADACHRSPAASNGPKAFCRRRCVRSSRCDTNEAGTKAWRCRSMGPVASCEEIRAGADTDPLTANSSKLVAVHGAAGEAKRMTKRWLSPAATGCVAGTGKLVASQKILR